MSTQEIIALFEKAVIPNYRRTPVVIVKGAGSRVWDADGKAYLDLFPGWGVAGLGHCHPAVVEAIREQAGALIHMANDYYSDAQGRFAATLHERSGGYQCFFCNSGAEAAEGAIKLARLHRTPKYKIITLTESFHGRTFAAITATGQPAYRKGFEPTVPGFAHAPLNDLEAVRALVDDETCAVMVEPVQGEAGVRPCRPEFLRGLRALCDEKDLLLILDEVQTAPARLGTWFGFQRYEVEPDIVTTAKAIAGGMPLGAFLAKPEVAASLKPGTHASTFGGHALGCAAGEAAWKAMAAEKVLANVATLGPVIDTHVEALRAAGGVADYRRAGFMVGIELDFPGAQVKQACMEKGLLINCTHETVLRLLPALNVTEAELAEGFAILAACVAEARAAALA